MSVYLRPIGIGILVLGAGLLAPERATAQDASNPKLEQIGTLNQEAVAACEGYSFKKARAKLHRALALATDAGLEHNPALAETYVLLGVACISGGNDLYRGLHYLVRAARLNPKIRVPRKLATPQLLNLQKTARATVKAVKKPVTINLGGAKGGPGTAAKAGKPGGRGLVHVPIDTAKRGYPIPVKATPGLDIQAHRVFLFYRPAGTVKFSRIPMKKAKGAFRAAIPAAATQGRYIHYYIEATDQRGRLAGSKGSARSPNVVIIK
jgi:hypothetical protein